MKSQIAVIGVGLAIAAAVAYAELKPNEPNQATPTVIQSIEATPSQEPNPAPVQTQKKLINPNSKPQINGGEHEGRESREHEGREHEGGEDD